jgi:hypothetical protein
VLHKKIKPAQNDVYGFEDMARCHHCGFDLRQAFAAEADVRIVKLNQEQMLLLGYGKGSVGGINYAISSEYFHELHGSMRRKLKSLWANDFYLTDCANEKCQVKKVEFEHASLACRVFLLV